MEDKLEKIFLYEMYKEMLTKNMQDVFEQYYFSDLSLREIGENNSVSYQAIRDTLKKTEKSLLQFEEKLKLGKIKRSIIDLNDYISKTRVDMNLLKDKIKKLGEI